MQSQQTYNKITHIAASIIPGGFLVFFLSKRFTIPLKKKKFSSNETIFKLTQYKSGRYVIEMNLINNNSKN